MKKIKLLTLFNNREELIDYGTFLTNKGRISIYPNSHLIYGSGKFLHYSKDKVLTEININTVFKFENNTLICC